MSNWFEVEILCNREGFDAVTGCLLRLDINGFEISDSEEFTAFTQDKDASWDYIDDKLLEEKNSQDSVKCYLPDNEQGRGQLELVRQEMKSLKERDDDDTFGSLEIKVSQVREEDWANNWKQYFKPIEIGKKLVIKPSWEEYSGDGSRIILEIDPASSFGTGQHHTTRLCLELLEGCVNGGEKILDMGCGSGILSIAAVLLGAQDAVAVDIEENAAATAAENAQKNNIPAEKYTTYFGNILSDEKLADRIDGKYDVITANIVADVLIAMKDHFLRYIRKGGTLIVSGIIEERMEEVLSAIEQTGFTRKGVNVKDGWAAAEFTLI